MRSNTVDPRLPEPWLPEPWLPEPRLPEPRLSKPSIIRIGFQAQLLYLLSISINNLAHMILIRFVLFRLIFASSKRLAI